jgi:hypothetical protein
MTRETWKRARQSFDRAYDEFHSHMLTAWKTHAASKEAK